MKNLVIDRTDNSPLVDFNVSNNVFLIQGESMPEDPRAFYTQILTWLEDYKKLLFYENDLNQGKIGHLVVELKFEYLNSISIKFIFDVLKKIEALKPYCKSIVVKWYYDENDSLMKENGVEYSTMVDLEFEQHQL